MFYNFSTLQNVYISNFMRCTFADINKSTPPVNAQWDNSYRFPCSCTKRKILDSPFSSVSIQLPWIHCLNPVMLQSFYLLTLLGTLRLWHISGRTGTSRYTSGVFGELSALCTTRRSIEIYKSEHGGQQWVWCREKDLTRHTDTFGKLIHLAVRE